MKKYIILLLVLLLCFFGLVKINKNEYNLWNSNSIIVSTDDKLDTKKVRIKYKNFSGEYIFFDGKQIKDLVNEYGENDFIIEYGNDYYFKFRHLKTNSNHQHDYNFHIFKQDTSLFVDVNIEGIDDRKVRGKMMKK